MDFSHFDTRNYPTVSVEEGYGEWAATYETVVVDALDIRLLERIRTVAWDQVREAVDLACGTGRTGTWLTQHGAGSVDGVDLTAEMLGGARAKGVYRQLVQADIRATPLASGAYDLVSVSLADEHLPDVAPLYQEAARLARPGGYLVLVGYHPYFMLSGVPTHYNRASGEAATIATHLHLLSNHVQAALARGWSLREMHEGLVDDELLAQKPKWSARRNWPVSFALVWQKER